MNSWIGQVIPPILVMLIAYLVGLTIVRIVDRRLSDISIHMPQIIIRPDELNESRNSVEHFENYYIHPDHMTGAQKKRFKKYAKLDKMSLEDYTHWLDLYSSLDEVPVAHHSNWTKLREQKKLEFGDLVNCQLTEPDYLEPPPCPGEANVQPMYSAPSPSQNYHPVKINDPLGHKYALEKTQPLSTTNYL